MKSARKTTQLTKRTNVEKKTNKAITFIRPLTASSLKDILWETLNDIKTDKIRASTGDAIASQAREILRTVKIQIQISNQTKQQLPKEVVDFSEKK